MPSSKWSIEPVFLCRKALPPDKNLYEFEAIANNALVGVLRQLSSLVNISNKLFEGLSEECLQLNKRTQKVAAKLTLCQQLVADLDPKAVKVPLGDFNGFLRREEHFRGRKEQNCNLFNPNNRPRCIRDAYETASTTPVHIIRTIDSYRSDGQTGTKLFVCQPVFKDMKKKVNFIDIELQKPANLVLAQELPTSVMVKRAKSPLCKTGVVLLEKDNEGRALEQNSSGARNGDQLIANELYRLPSPQEQMAALSQEFPSSFIPIDVTGTSFHRMSSFRKSLIHSDYMIRRRKSEKSRDKQEKMRRRNTICESTKDMVQNYRSSRVRRRSDGSIDHIDNGCQTEYNEEEIYRTGRVVEFNGNRDKGAGDGRKIQLKAQVHRENRQSVASLYDNLATVPKMIDSGTDMQKGFGGSQSLKLSANPTNGSTNTEIKSCRGFMGDASSLSGAVSDAVKLREASRGKGAGDDGRSSSGNWSASSSTHASVDSDPVTSNGIHAKGEDPLSRSSSSIGKDSVISDSMMAHHDTDTTSTQEFNGYTSDTSAMSSYATRSLTLPTPGAAKRSSTTSSSTDVVIRTNPGLSGKVQYANRDSESWLQYFDHSSSDTITPTEGTLTDSEATPKVMSPVSGSRRSSIHEPQFPVDDEAESVYSIDTDGYYTSMHTDSGLFKGRPGIKLMITPNSSFRCKGKRCSISSVSTVGDISINSVLSKTETEVSSPHELASKERRGGRRAPPRPPSRISSLRSGSSRKDSISESITTMLSNGSNSSRSHSPSPGVVTTSESENSEEKERRKGKTTIEATRSYPSMCANITTSEGSDDCSSSSDGSNPSTPSGRRSSSYKGFRIKDIFGIASLTALSKSLSKSRESVGDKVAKPLLPFNMYGDIKSKNNAANGSKLEKSRLRFFGQSPDSASRRVTSFGSNENCTNELMTGNISTSSGVRSDHPLSKTRPSPPTMLFPISRTVPKKADAANHFLSSGGKTNYAGRSQTPLVGGSLPRRPNTLTLGESIKRPASGARVTLDSNGDVIYASNSLGRRRDDHPMNYLNQLQQPAVKSEQKSATLPQINKSKFSSPSKSGPPVGLGVDGNVQATDPSSRPSSKPYPFKSMTPLKVPIGSPSDLPYSAPASRCTTPLSLQLKSSSRPNTPASGFPSSSGTYFQLTAVPKLLSTSILDTSFSPVSTSSPIKSPLSPGAASNGSGNSTTTSTSSDSKSTASSTAKKSKLSTEDLLVLIHNSKKKLNIKTDSCLSPIAMPSPKRAVTPTHIYSSTSRSNPPSPQVNGSVNRRSWACSGDNTNTTVVSSPNELPGKKSLACDRLGPSKPTTIRDFKRLLSQARCNTPNERKSAAEILQVTSFSSKRPLTPTVSSASSFLNNLKPVANGKDPPAVPAKTRVINGRLYRTPYHLEKMYPPIEEDIEEGLRKSAEELDQKKESPKTEAKTLSSQKSPANNYIKLQTNPNSTSTWV